MKTRESGTCRMPRLSWTSGRSVERVFQATAIYVGLPHLAIAACCESGSACEQLRASTTVFCAPGSICANLDTLSRTTLRLHNSDMRPLELAQKDLAGTYRLDLSAMRLINEWVVGDAPGITRPGRSEVALRRICTDSRQVEISGSVFLFGFNLLLTSANPPATRKFEGRVFDGLEGAINGANYFFTRAPR